MKLNFGFPVKGLDGKPLGERTAGEILANDLAFINKNNSIKLFDWAVKIHNGKDIEIDDADYGVLKAIIETTDSFPNVTKYALLSYMDSVKNGGVTTNDAGGPKDPPPPPKPPVG